MVSMEELLEDVRHTVGVKKSVELVLAGIVGRISDSFATGGPVLDAHNNLRAEIAQTISDIKDYLEVVRNNAEELAAAVAENQRQHPKAEHKYKKRGKK